MEETVQKKRVEDKILNLQSVIKKEKCIGRCGATSRRPVGTVCIILENLIAGVQPMSVPKIMQTYATEYTGEELDELPSVNFIRQCRTIAQVVNEILAAIKLGHNHNWKQLFTDGTMRRQIDLTTLIIGLMDDGGLDRVVVSSCLLPEDATSEGQVQAIKEKVSGRKMPAVVCDCNYANN